MTASPISPGHHSLPVTASPISPGHHSQPVTASPVSPGHHSQPVTASPISPGHHSQPVTASPISPGHHSQPVTASPSRRGHSPELENARAFVVFKHERKREGERAQRERERERERVCGCEYLCVRMSMYVCMLVEGGGAEAGCSQSCKLVFFDEGVMNENAFSYESLSTALPSEQFCRWCFPLSICLSLCLSACLSVCLSEYPPPPPLSLSLSLREIESNTYNRSHGGNDLFSPFTQR